MFDQMNGVLFGAVVGSNLFRMLSVADLLRLYHSLSEKQKGWMDDLQMDMRRLVKRRYLSEMEALRAKDPIFRGFVIRDDLRLTVPALAELCHEISHCEITEQALIDPISSEEILRRGFDPLSRLSRKEPRLKR